MYSMCKVCSCRETHFYFPQWCAQDNAWRGAFQAEGDEEEHHQLLSWGTSQHPCRETNHFYQFYCGAAVLWPSTRGSTRPPGSPWSGSHLYPHISARHKTPSPFHKHRPDRALGSISDRWSRLSRPLCRNLCGEGQRLASVWSSHHGENHRTQSVLMVNL